MITIQEDLTPIKSISNPAQFVDMELGKGMNTLNYYWMEGPLTGDQGRLDQVDALLVAMAKPVS